MGKTGAEARNGEGARGGALFSKSQSGRGFGGWGSRFGCPYLAAAPITGKSALSDNPLSLGIGRANVD